MEHADVSCREVTAPGTRIPKAAVEILERLMG
jgi:hypothetical protein